VSYLSGLAPDVLQRIGAAFKAARYAAERQDMAGARKLFARADGDWRASGSDSALDDDRRYAWESIYGTQAQQAAARSDTRAGQALVAQGRVNAAPAPVPSTWDLVAEAVSEVVSSGPSVIAAPTPPIPTTPALNLVAIQTPNTPVFAPGEKITTWWGAPTAPKAIPTATPVAATSKWPYILGALSIAAVGTVAYFKYRKRARRQ
jgi:hypothetical protein